ncbi:mucin-5AC-like [Ixodes scapularis]|uniref:mucin-5AC-like n=1 Tax=Ixodes scapularis TaxID=6945 RepID=UPI001A9E7BCA|nr:mucin-5AC-like [Ixodes scapularis]
MVYPLLPKESHNALFLLGLPALVDVSLRDQPDDIIGCGVSSTVLPETVSTTAPFATNAVETSSAMGSSSTESSLHHSTTQSSAAIDGESSTARLPIRETTVQTTMIPETTTAPITQPRVTLTITSTSAQRETTALYVHSTNLPALPSASEKIVTSATASPVLITTVNQMSTGPWNTTTSAAPAQQTSATNKTRRPTWTTNMSQPSSHPQELTTFTPPQRATRRYDSTSAAFSISPRRNRTTTPTTSTQSRTSGNTQTSIAWYSAASTPTTASLTTSSSPQETSNLRFSPTWRPSGTRSRTPSPSTQKATARMTSASTTYKPYTARRLTTLSTTSNSVAYTRTTRQRFTILPVFTRYTRNTRYPLRNRTVFYVPTTQAPSVRTTSIVSRFPSSRPRVFTRTNTVSLQPTTGKPSADVRPTTRKTYATVVHGATRVTGVTLVTAQRDLKPGLLGTTSRAVTFKTELPPTESPKSSHGVSSMESTVASGISTKTTSGLPTKPTKPTRKTVKPHHANDFTKWTKKPSLKTVAPAVSTHKQFTPSGVHSSTFGDWVEENNAFPSESPGANSGDQIPEVVETPGDIDDNEIPLLNSAPSRNQGYMAKPQQSASVRERGASWGLLALKIGMATACALGLALAVMFIMLRCRRRPALGLSDDSEMKPLSQFEQSEAADGAS